MLVFWNKKTGKGETRMPTIVRRRERISEKSEGQEGAMQRAARLTAD